MVNRLATEAEAASRWELSPEVRKALVATATQMMPDKTASKRERQSAMKILLACERQNQADDANPKNEDQNQQQGAVIYRLPENGRDRPSGG